MTKLSKNAQVPQCDKTAVMQSVIASELRIGNLVFGNYENEEDEIIHSTVCKILGYDPFNNYYWVENKQGIEEFCNFQPIQITEKRLLEFGFKKELDSFYRFNKSTMVEICFYDNGILVCNQSVCLSEIKFIHQLQNLFHSLTGRELTVA